MKPALILLIPILTVSALQAQVPPDPGQSASIAARVEREVADPTLTSGGRGTAPAISFQFSKDDSTATAQIGGQLVTGAADRWGLTVSGPVSKSSPKTTLATNEGLNSGFNAELLVRRIFLVPIPATELRSMCKQFVSRDSCSSGDPDMPPAGKLAFDTAFPPTWTIGGSVKVGRKQFDFTTPNAFNDQSETHDGVSFSLAGGFFPSTGSLLYYVGGSFRHESAFVAGSTSNICTPISGSSSTVCRDIVIGAPQRRTSNLLQVEARSFFGKTMGIAPRATYETEQRAWSIDLPIYLRQGDGPFNGGVDVGWDSKKHTVLVSLFVGALPKLTN